MKSIFNNGFDLEEYDSDIIKDIIEYEKYCEKMSIIHIMYEEDSNEE